MRVVVITLLGLVLAGCASSLDQSASCAQGEGCLNDWYQYQMMTVDPQTGKVVNGPIPLTSQTGPQPSSVQGTQSGAVK